MPLPVHIFGCGDEYKAGTAHSLDNLLLVPEDFADSLDFCRTVRLSF